MTAQTPAEQAAEDERFIADVRRQATYEADRFPNDDWPPIVLALLQRLDQTVDPAAVDAAREQGRREGEVAGLRTAADEVHTEARWSLEKAMRGEPQDTVDRLIVVQKVLTDRADRIKAETQHPNPYEQRSVQDRIDAGFEAVRQHAVDTARQARAKSKEKDQ